MLKAAMCVSTGDSLSAGTEKETSKTKSEMQESPPILENVNTVGLFMRETLGSGKHNVCGKQALHRTGGGTAWR